MPDQILTPSGDGEMGESVATSFDSLAKVITAGSEAAGVGFEAASILKFKTHKDNPTQIPVGSAAEAASAVKAAASEAGVTSSEVKAAASDAGITSSEVSSAASAAEDKLSE
jgi:hypothetical protein